MRIVGSGEAQHEVFTQGCSFAVGDSDQQRAHIGPARGKLHVLGENAIDQYLQPFALGRVDGFTHRGQQVLLFVQVVIHRREIEIAHHRKRGARGLPVGAVLRQPLRQPRERGELRTHTIVTGREHLQRLVESWRGRGDQRVVIQSGRKPAGFLLKATEAIHANTTSAAKKAAMRIPFVRPRRSAIMPSPMYTTSPTTLAVTQPAAKGYCAIITARTMAVTSSKVSMTCGNTRTSRFSSRLLPLIIHTPRNTKPAILMTANIMCRCLIPKYKIAPPGLLTQAGIEPAIEYKRMEPNTNRISPVMLRQIPFFRALSDEDLENVLRHTRELRFAKGQVLFNRGDPAQGFHFVIEGQIKLAISSPSGNEKVVEVIHPMQTFGEAVMLLDRPYPVFAQAALDSRLLHIGQGIVSELIDHDPIFARKLLAGMAMRLHGLIQDVETYSLQSSTQRVIGYLLQSSGEESTGAPIAFDLPTSKQTIASRLNLTPETLSRIFADLSQAGLIHMHGKHVELLDPKRLADFGT